MACKSFHKVLSRCWVLSKKGRQHTFWNLNHSTISRRLFSFATSSSDHARDVDTRCTRNSDGLVCICDSQEFLYSIFDSWYNCISSSSSGITFCTLSRRTLHTLGCEKHLWISILESTHRDGDGNIGIKRGAFVMESKRIRNDRDSEFSFEQFQDQGEGGGERQEDNEHVARSSGCCDTSKTKWDYMFVKGHLFTWCEHFISCLEILSHD